MPALKTQAIKLQMPLFWILELINALLGEFSASSSDAASDPRRPSRTFRPIRRGKEREHNLKLVARPAA